MNYSTLTFKRWLMPSLLILFTFGSLSAAEIPSQRDPSGIVSHSVSSSHGQQILSSYTGSYALLIGESEYTNGWSTLENIPSELDQVEQVLRAQGFHVEKSFNLKAEQLRARFRRFINQYGFDENNRLLFFYSGHGYTRKDKGYIVPTDAPNPDFNKKGFLQKAVTMNDWRWHRHR